MIGRGSYGSPWIVGAVSRALQGKDPGSPPSGAALADLVIEQYESTLACYGSENGVKCMRKHLSWYLDDTDCGIDLRRRVLTTKDTDEVLRLIPEALASESKAAA